MGKGLVVAALFWPVLLGGAVWARQAGAHPLWTDVVYAATSYICHQRPDRSFRTHDVQWPVCGRCAGLYLGAPIGALLAAGVRRRSRLSPRHMVGIAAVPTVATVAAEWLHVMTVSNMARLVAAVPLGLAIAYVLIAVVTPWPESNRGTLNGNE